MNKKYLALIIVSILLIIGAIYYYFFILNGKLSVDQTEVAKTKVIKTVSASGKIKSENDAKLSFKTTGRITDIKFKKGEHVSKGDLVAILDSRSARASVKSYRDALDIKLRDKDLFLKQYLNHKDAIGGESQFDINLRRINEQISQAEAVYNSQAYTISDYELRSPIDGILLDVNKKVGEIAGLTEVFAEVANPDTVIFETSIDQEDFGQIKENQSAIINLDPYDGTEFKGTVTKLPNYANSSGANADQFTVEITMNKTDVPLLIGMKGDASISVNEKDNVNALMFDEIFEEKDSTKKFVWTLKDNKLHKEFVETGLEGDVYTEIKSDLSNKTIVVPINKTDKLAEGVKAKIADKSNN